MAKSSCSCRQHQVSGHTYLVASSTKSNRRRCWAEGPLSHRLPSAERHLISAIRNAERTTNNRKKPGGDQTPFAILLRRRRTCKIWKNKRCWDIVLLHFSWCSPLWCPTKLGAVCIFKQIGSDSVLTATALSIGLIIECLSSFSLVFIGH